MQDGQTRLSLNTKTLTLLFFNLMTERKIIHLNQCYDIRVDFDLEEKEIFFCSLFRKDGGHVEDYFLDLTGLIDSEGDCENHIEVLEKSMEIMKEVTDWINSLDIESLIAEHAECEAEERRAETREDMERNG